MLRFLKIRDFALIEELELEFEKGLTCVTGETGSGKSLILDAISSILGARCNTINIRNGAKKYSVEAIFDISDNAEVRAWLLEKSIDIEENDLYLKKELMIDGKSRIQIGASLAPASYLKELGFLLSEVHRQNEQLFILERDTQLNYLDEFASLGGLKKQVREKFHEFKDVKDRLQKIIGSDEERNRRVDLLNYQIHEIKSIDPKPGEEDELLKDELLLINGEKTAENYGILSHYLTEKEDSILSNFVKILNASDKILQYNPGFSDMREELYETYNKLKDISHSINSDKEEIFYSEERLELVQKRLDEINKLKRKYGKTIEDVLDYSKKSELELEAINSSSENIGILQKELEKSTSELTKLAVKLSEFRREAILKLESYIQKELTDLGMKDARLQIVLRWEQSGDGEISESGRKYVINETGLDQIDFYFSANAGEKPRPLRKIISGGEMSRVMLALKSILNKDKNKLLIFDEIDSGIGGEVANIVGDKLKKISSESQVLLITHLHQIAALSDYQMKVYKDVKNGRTFTSAEFVPDERRAEEIAKMMAGENLTKGVINFAEKLLKKAV